jgi:hypothetical protein
MPSALRARSRLLPPERCHLPSKLSQIRSFADSGSLETASHSIEVV